MTFSMPGRLPGAVLSSAPAAERRATRRRLHLASLPLSLLPYLFPSLPPSPLPLPSSSFPPRRPGEAVAGAQPGGAGRARGGGFTSIVPRPLPLSLRPPSPAAEPRLQRETPGAGPGRGSAARSAAPGTGRGPAGEQPTAGGIASRSAGGARRGRAGCAAPRAVGAGPPCRSVFPVCEREFRNSAANLARRVWGLRLSKANSSGKERD